ncbi:MAG: hypothetical protein ACT4N9_03105 [Paracoccaceae bacterium]
MLALLEPTLSQARLGKYVLAAGHEEAKALALYQWNARLGEAFHLPIQAVEVALRNRINTVLVSTFGAEWWKDPGFHKIADRRQCDQIEVAKTRIARRGQVIVTGQIVAGLSFGFWVSMLDKRYNPNVWSRTLRTGFPDLPAGRSREELQRAARQVADFRNRIWHHEPIFQDDIT